MNRLPIVLCAWALLAVSVHADYLINEDFKDSSGGWRGDGERVLLKADNTEGTDADTDATPVMKITLSHSESRSIYQEFEARDTPTTMHVSVEVMASPDFKRGAPPYGGLHWQPGSTWYWSGIEIPDVDFWIRGSPAWYYKLSNLKPGAWVTVDGRFEDLSADRDRSVYFCVPAGVGCVYVKNPKAAAK